MFKPLTANLPNEPVETEEPLTVVKSFIVVEVNVVFERVLIVVAFIVPPSTLSPLIWSSSKVKVCPVRLIFDVAIVVPSIVPPFMSTVVIVPKSATVFPVFVQLPLILSISMVVACIEEALIVLPDILAFDSILPSTIKLPFIPAEPVNGNPPTPVKLLPSPNNLPN